MLLKLNLTGFHENYELNNQNKMIQIKYFSK
jgi:hypothetical protein